MFLWMSGTACNELVPERCSMLPVKRSGKMWRIRPACPEIHAQNVHGARFDARVHIGILLFSASQEFERCDPMFHSNCAHFGAGIIQGGRGARASPAPGCCAAPTVEISGADYSAMVDK
ncbi:hypothetical protein AVEN_243347-1 [Araneus ventricosus]|uniref:Uncharacterized protein n=1 Tax=Araneus ventricosus TaxID=182803 RepID=A0A4Y2HBD7_ARAVE|nr:hypothetical protein AVEN_243347-1 [Araneus ventricosus]